MNIINRFNNEYSFLSNFANSPIIWKGQHWPTVEHLYQAAKTARPKEQQIIRISSTPGKAKRRGQKVTLRADWDTNKYNIMRHCISLKFDQNCDLAQKLIDTGQAILIEGNVWHDNIWGNCECPKCENKEGLNILGKQLMELRMYLQDKIKRIT